jgi:DNA topoisomerase-1
MGEQVCDGSQNNKSGVAVSGSTVRFEFPGKSGIKHSIDLQDRRLVGIVRQCLDLPG